MRYTGVHFAIHTFRDGEVERGGDRTKMLSSSPAGRARRPPGRSSCAPGVQVA